MYHIKKDKRSIQSATMVYEALGRLLEKMAYEKINISCLVEEANIGRTTFYRLFDNIDDVLDWECEKRHEELFEYMSCYYRHDEKKRIYFIVPFLEFWEKDSIIIELLIKSKRIRIFDQNFRRFFKRIIDSLPDEHVNIRENIDYFIALRTGVAVYLLIQWIENGKDITPMALQDILIDQTQSLSKTGILNKESL